MYGTTGKYTLTEEQLPTGTTGTTGKAFELHIGQTLFKLDHLHFLCALADRRSLLSVDRTRLKKVFQNDVENTAIHAVFFWAAFVVQFLANSSGHGHSETLALTILFIMYCGFRFVYRICSEYWEGLVLFLGNACVEATLVVMAISAFQVDMGDFSQREKTV
jgi:hypothetical protein